VNCLVNDEQRQYVIVDINTGHSCRRRELNLRYKLETDLPLHHRMYAVA